LKLFFQFSVHFEFKIKSLGTFEKRNICDVYLVEQQKSFQKIKQKILRKEKK
jgi:hypothetical protein